MAKLKVSLNGTSENPWHRFGLKQNPFPQLARKETDAAALAVQSLGGDPIPHDRAEAYIREKIGGHCTEEFVSGVVKRFRPGELVEFWVVWKEK